MQTTIARDIVLIDAGGANLGSVRYALERLGIAPRIVRDGAQHDGAERILLPGVGAAGHGMACLHAQNFIAPLRASRVPLLGICLGMQLLYESSEEDGVDCLGLLPGRVRQMRDAPGIRVPHMGWNTLSLRRDCALVDGIVDGAHAYFVHGYAAPVDDATVATSAHGDAFAAIMQRGHCHGVQFHPERSAAAGLRILANFVGVDVPVASVAPTASVETVRA
ncbi:MAG: imidazole glycerol phosphate synthase subunit HisH [Luteimonas sp.]